MTFNIDIWHDGSTQVRFVGEGHRLKSNVTGGIMYLFALKVKIMVKKHTSIGNCKCSNTTNWSVVHTLGVFLFCNSSIFHKFSV